MRGTGLESYAPEGGGWGVRTALQAEGPQCRDEQGVREALLPEKAGQVMDIS